MYRAADWRPSRNLRESLTTKLDNGKKYAQDVYDISLVEGTIVLKVLHLSSVDIGSSWRSVDAGVTQIE